MLILYVNYIQSKIKIIEKNEAKRKEKEKEAEEKEAKEKETEKETRSVSREETEEQELNEVRNQYHYFFVFYNRVCKRDSFYVIFIHELLNFQKLIFWIAYANAIQKYLMFDLDIVY